MPNIRTVLQRLKSVFNDVAWGADGSPTVRGASGRSYFVPGTSLNWDSVTGDLWTCPAVQACLNWKFRNFPQARPVVRTKNREDEFEIIPDHPLEALMATPNQEYDYTTFIMGAILSWDTNGNAYIAIERNGHGVPVELYWLPHHLVKPKRDKTGEKYYQYTVNGKQYKIPKEDIVHLRFGIDPYSTLLGMAPLASVNRGVYTLQMASNYAARAMMNGGLIGGLATSEDVNHNFDPEEFVARWQAKTTGDKAGEMMAYDGPIKLQFPNITPQDMAIETMQDRPEADVCALLGIPPQVAGLHVGRLAKTYANMKEARESAWEEGLIPMGTIFASQIGRQLLPQVSVQRLTTARTPNEYLWFDMSDIRPLQPDLDALHVRAREDWKANLIDRATWKRIVGQKPLPEDEGVFFSDFKTMIPNPPEDKQDAIAQRKSLDWAERITTEIKLLEAA